MNFFIKHRLEILILTVLTLAYFILRLPNLTLQPIFADEAIYIRWAQVMKAESTLRFLPLSDGKTPLFMWMMIPILKFIYDPLLAGRLLSVISGFFTLVGVFFLSKRIFNIRTAFWASLLYTITPYTVFFDRMALVDSMLSAFTIWSVYFAILLVSNLRLDISMILGYMLGGAILTKTTGMISFFILPFSILGFKREKDRKYNFVKLAIFWIVAITIGFITYNILRLGPNFHMLSLRNADYVFSPLELLGRPLDPFIPHFHDIADWFPKLLTWPILFCIVIGILYIIIGFLRGVVGPYPLGAVILLWAVIPLILNMAFLKTFTARYLLPEIPLLLILAGFGVTRLLPPLAYIKRFPVILMIVVLLPLPLYFNFYLLTRPDKAPLPKEERQGYFEQWTAGYGLADMAKLILEKGQSQKVIVGTEGFFGTLPEGIQIYLDKSKIPVIGSTASISASIRNAAKDNLTFFIGNKRSLEGGVSNVVLIKEYPKFKPLDNSLQDATVLYQVLP